MYIYIKRCLRCPLTCILCQFLALHDIFLMTINNEFMTRAWNHDPFSWFMYPWTSRSSGWQTERATNIFGKCWCPRCILHMSNTVSSQIVSAETILFWIFRCDYYSRVGNYSKEETINFLLFFIPNMKSNEVHKYLLY